MTSRCMSVCPNEKWGAFMSKANTFSKGYIYIYIPGTQMTLVLIGKGLFWGGWPSKIEVKWVLGIYIYISTNGATIGNSQKTTSDVPRNMRWYTPQKTETPEIIPTVFPKRKKSIQHFVTFQSKRTLIFFSCFFFSSFQREWTLASWWF